MKHVPIQDELELEDFMVEIDLLTECKHKNIVELYEAFFYDQALWVSVSSTPPLFIYVVLGYLHVSTLLHVKLMCVPKKSSCLVPP